MQNSKMVPDEANTRITKRQAAALLACVTLCLSRFRVSNTAPASSAFMPMRWSAWTHVRKCRQNKLKVNNSAGEVLGWSYKISVLPVKQCNCAYDSLRIGCIKPLTDASTDARMLCWSTWVCFFFFILQAKNNLFERMSYLCHVWM